MADGTEPVDDHETLYRRIMLEHFDPDQGLEPSPKAFHPRKYDQTGLSVFRAKYATPEDVARNDRGKRYYIAVLRAVDLRANGLDVIPRTEGNVPGHAELPGLTYENRYTDAAVEAKQLLARKLCLKILGPLPP